MRNRKILENAIERLLKDKIEYDKEIAKYEKEKLSCAPEDFYRLRHLNDSIKECNDASNDCDVNIRKYLDELCEVIRINGENIESPIVERLLSSEKGFE